MRALSSLKRFRVLGVIGLMSVAGGCFSLDTSIEGLAVLAIISGNQQTIQAGAAAPAALVVRAYDENAISLPDVDVDWTINTTGGSLSATSTTTDDTGTASVTFTAPTTPGNVQIRASAEGLSVTFNLTVVPASGT
jgi:hypothetical protein